MYIYIYDLPIESKVRPKRPRQLMVVGVEPTAVGFPTGFEFVDFFLNSLRGARIPGCTTVVSGNISVNPPRLLTKQGWRSVPRFRQWKSEKAVSRFPIDSNFDQQNWSRMKIFGKIMVIYSYLFT